MIIEEIDNKLTKHSLPYISGMGYREKCDFIYDEFYKFNIHHIDQFNGMKIFIKTDLLNDFIKRFLPFIITPFIIYTHNSDKEINSIYNDLLNHHLLEKWFGQNINLNHPKLFSLPIGIANARWDHGNTKILDQVIKENNSKDNVVYCNFDLKTNIVERKKCINNIGDIKMDERQSFYQYLKKISKSYFVISPNGNGVDCHKHWESLYLNTIPIVTESINISFYKDYPFLVIKNWEEFNKLELTEELYHNIWDNFDKNKLFI